MHLPLNREQFNEALKKGLGRALRHVRAYGEGEFREDILYACLHKRKVSVK